MSGTYPMFPGLVIGIPLTGRPLPPQFTFSFAGLHPPMNFNVTHITTYQAPIADARNYFAEQALAIGAKYLMTIDEDVTMPGYALRQLYMDLVNRPEAMVVGGVVCHKAPPPMPMLFRNQGVGPFWDWKVGELFEVDGIGMGCTMIRTEIFKKLPKPWFKTIDTVDKYWDGVPAAEAWTEDLYFCHQIKQAGFEHAIWGDGGVLCEHWDMTTMKPTVLPAYCPPRLRAVTDKPGDKKIVDLGCGDSPLETAEGTVIKVDIREEVNPDYRCDLRHTPFGNKEFDIVYSAHVLEHFSRVDCEKALDEWIRILKDNGEFRIIVPNIKWAAERIASGVIDNDVLNVLYGAQTFDENFHKVGFTPETLANMLTARGFKRIDVQLQGYNILMRAWRIEPDEKEVPKLGIAATT